MISKIKVPVCLLLVIQSYLCSLSSESFLQVLTKHSLKIYINKTPNDSE